MPSQFVVPQFIDAEAHILGPVTARQFVILLVTAIVIAITYVLTSYLLFIILMLLEAGIGLIIAFVKINGQNFHYFLLNIIMTLRKPGVRVWGRQLTDEYLKLLMHTEAPPPVVRAPHKEFISSRRLSELSLVVNTGGVYRPDEDLS